MISTGCSVASKRFTAEGSRLKLKDIRSGNCRVLGCPGEKESSLRFRNDFRRRSRKNAPSLHLPSGALNPLARFPSTQDLTCHFLPAKSGRPWWSVVATTCFPSLTARSTACRVMRPRNPESISQGPSSLTPHPVAFLPLHYHLAAGVWRVVQERSTGFLTSM